MGRDGADKAFNVSYRAYGSRKGRRAMQSRKLREKVGKVNELLAGAVSQAAPGPCKESRKL